VQCNYCEETDEHTVLIAKPDYFIYEGTLHYLVQVYSQRDNVCLTCLEHELDALKNS
jgi:hypothetical protein